MYHWHKTTQAIPNTLLYRHIGTHNYSKSFKNKANDTDDKFSPCLTPQKLDFKDIHVANMAW